MTRFAVSTVVRTFDGAIAHELALWRARDADHAEALALADALRMGALMGLQVLPTDRPRAVAAPAGPAGLPRIDP